MKYFIFKNIRMELDLVGGLGRGKELRVLVDFKNCVLVICSFWNLRSSTYFKSFFT